MERQTITYHIVIFLRESFIFITYIKKFSDQTYDIACVREIVKLID